MGETTQKFVFTNSAHCAIIQTVKVFEKAEMGK